MTNSESETKTPPKLKKTPPASSSSARDSLTPPSINSLSIKSEARSPHSAGITAPADSSSSRLGYPSPAITPGSSQGEASAIDLTRSFYNTDYTCSHYIAQFKK